MKQAIYKTNYMMRNFYEPEKEILIGFIPGYMWKKVSYFGGPKKYGKYLVINKYGYIEEMYCTGTHSDIYEARNLFNLVASECPENLSFIDKREMTDTDIMDIYRNPQARWYTIKNWQEYDTYGRNIYVYSEKSDEYPLYFLDLNLEAPIELDDNGEIQDVDGVQYFNFDDDNEEIEEEDI